MGVELQLVTNHEVSAFTNARGKVFVNVAEGFVRLGDRVAFPCQVVQHDAVYDSAPRLEKCDGNVGNTSCELRGTGYQNPLAAI